MVYQGSKARIAKDIVPILQECIDRNKVSKYIEPFVGGANIIDKVNCFYKIGYDINEYLIALLVEAKLDPELQFLPEECSFEHYKEVRDSYNKKDGKYYRYFKDKDGNIHDTKVELTLTCTDYKLILVHYRLEDLEILDGCWFYADAGIFDQYINKYKKIKMENKGAKRTEAKLFLNNLYGKLATSMISSFKYAEVAEDEKDKCHNTRLLEEYSR